MRTSDLTFLVGVSVGEAGTVSWHAHLFIKVGLHEKFRLALITGVMRMRAALASRLWVEGRPHATLSVQ